MRLGPDVRRGVRWKREVDVSVRRVHDDRLALRDRIDAEPHVAVFRRQRLRPRRAGGLDVAVARRRIDRTVDSADGAVAVLHPQYHLRSGGYRDVEIDRPLMVMEPRMVRREIRRDLHRAFDRVHVNVDLREIALFARAFHGPDVHRARCAARDADVAVRIVDLHFSAGRERRCLVDGLVILVVVPDVGAQCQGDRNRCNHMEAYLAAWGFVSAKRSLINGGTAARPRERAAAELRSATTGARGVSGLAAAELRSATIQAPTTNKEG